jgi:hypothetical protein
VRPVVRLDAAEVDDACLCATNVAFGGAGLDGHAIHLQAPSGFIRFPVLLLAAGNAGGRQFRGNDRRPTFCHAGHF